MSDFSQPWLEISRSSKGTSLLEYKDVYKTFQLEAESDFPPQNPIAVAFIGHHSKNNSLQQLVGVPVKREETHEQIKLMFDPATKHTENPLIFVDCEVHNFRNPGRHAPTPSGGEIIEHPLQSGDANRSDRGPESLAYRLYARTLAPLTHVMCFFAADLGGLKGVAKQLVRWIDLLATSDLPAVLLPRALVVMETNSTFLNEKTLQEKLRTHMINEVRDRKGFVEEDTLPWDLNRHFRSLAVFSFGKRSRFDPSSIDRLRCRISLECNAVHSLRAKHNFSFNKFHFSAYLSLLCAHFCATPSDSFRFILATRLQNPVSEQFELHLSELIDMQDQESFKMTIPQLLVSTALVLDSCPPGMHYFPPDIVFEHLYQDSCEAALRHYNHINSDRKIPTTFLAALKRSFQSTYRELALLDISAVQSHRKKLQELQDHLKSMKSNTTCLCCLMRKPEKVLSCGHALCDQCVRSFGKALKQKAYVYLLNKCTLCGVRNIGQLFRYQPPTSGIRVLSIDGGGIKGVIPLAYLEKIQERLLLSVPIQDHFDHVIGTSAGGLIVLGLFLMKWTPEECQDHFRTFARHAFEPRKLSNIPVLSKISSLIFAYFADCMYETDSIEKALTLAFGPNIQMFNPLTTDIKVAVTATRGTIPCMFTNYNGQNLPGNECDYELMRANWQEKDVKIADAARCTSAAPGYFRTKSLKSLGTFQDGGLCHNNPIKLAIAETRRVWGNHKRNDFAISLGTGTSQLFSGNKSDQSSSSVKDGFFLRLYKSFMASLDGEKTWAELANGLEEGARSRYHRLNVKFVGLEPKLDDILIMDSLRQQTSCQVDTDARISAVIDSILASMFYMELEKLPVYVSGQYQCRAIIYCRLHDSNPALNQLLKRLAQSSSRFVIFGKSLPCVRSLNKNSWNGFSLPLSFEVRSLEDILQIFISGITTEPRQISGFPQTVNNLIKMQGLYTPFGWVDHAMHLTRGNSPPELLKKRKRVD